MWASALLLLAGSAVPCTTALRAPMHLRPPELRLQDPVELGQARWLLAIAARGPAPELSFLLSRTSAWRPQTELVVEVHGLARRDGRGAVVQPPRGTVRLMGRRHAVAVGQVALRAPAWAGRRRDGWRSGSGVKEGVAAWWLALAGPTRIVSHVAAGRGGQGAARSPSGAAPGLDIDGLTLAPGTTPGSRWLMEANVSALWRSPSGTQLWLLGQGQIEPLRLPQQTQISGRRGRGPPAVRRARAQDGNSHHRGPVPWRLTTGLMRPALGGHLHLWGSARPHGQRIGVRYLRAPQALSVSYRHDGPARHSLAMAQHLDRGFARAGWAATFRPGTAGASRPRQLSGHVALPLGRPWRRLRYDVSLTLPSPPGAGSSARTASSTVPRMWLSLRMRPPVALWGLAWQGAVGWLGPQRGPAARGQAAVQLGPATVRARLQLHSSHIFGGVEAFFCL